MTDDKNIKQAKTVFETMCSAFDNYNLIYDKKEDEFELECIMSGEDIPMNITIKLFTGLDIIMLSSLLQSSTPKSNIIDMAIAVNYVNNKLMHGSFDFDVKEGSISFRMANTYTDCLPDEEVFMYMLYSSCKIIDEYNDRFLMLSKGLITLSDFLKHPNKGDKK